MITALRQALGLFDSSTRRKLALAIAGSVLIALAEVGAVVLVLPLMALLLGQEDNTAVATLRQLLNDPSDERLAAILAAAVLGSFVFKAVVALTIRWWTLGLISRESTFSASRLLRYYLYAPMSLHVKRGTADLLRMINDAQAIVFTSVVAGWMSVITEAITMLAMIVTLLVLEPTATIIVVGFFGLVGWATQRAIRDRALRNGERLMISSYLSGRAALHALGGIKEIKLRNEQEVFVADFMKHRLESGETGRSNAFLIDLPKHTLEILFVMGVAVMTVVAFASHAPQGAVGLLAIFVVAGFRVLPSSVRLISSLSVIRSGAGALALVRTDLLASRNYVPTENPQSVDKLPFLEKVTFNDVSFRYVDGTEDVLRGINLEIPAGTSLALVGTSGAGKSTLVDMLLGLQKPTGGQILVDGVDVAENIGAWQANLGMVPQDVYLLDNSLRENIHFALANDPDHDTALMRVVKQAQLDDVLALLPEGLDTSVGERGTRLSGGQRQRVGIARALFRDPALLVLDEATSALDNEPERRITSTIEALHGQVTVVIVAHRLSTVRRCDQVAFLEGGRIEAIGTFDEVRTAHAKFAHLVELGSLDPPHRLDDVGRDTHV